MLPKDPILLMSVVNTKLRDRYPSERAGGGDRRAPCRRGLRLRPGAQSVRLKKILIRF